MKAQRSDYIYNGIVLRLTEENIQILTLVAQGKTAKEINAVMGRTPSNNSIRRNRCLTYVRNAARLEHMGLVPAACKVAYGLGLVRL